MKGALFKAVPRELTLAERTQRQIEGLIVGRELKPGERLPSEAELGRMLGVSRTVVREAVRLLTARGLVEARNGLGVFVRAIGPGVLADPMALLYRSGLLGERDITEVRRTLEQRIAWLAAESARPADLAGMEASIRALEDPALSDEELAVEDAGFHERLAAATGNPLYAILAGVLLGLLRERVFLASFRVDRAGSIEDSLRHHGRILARVRARDPAGARRAMLDHLTESEEWTRSALAHADRTQEDDGP